MSKGNYSFNKTVNIIKATLMGQERNMYSHIKDIFVNTLGFGIEDIKIDTRTNAGGIPDLAVNTNGMARWIVVEVKDEKGVFYNDTNRQNIFEQKHRYIETDTEWFVFIDPGFIFVRAVQQGKKKETYAPASDIKVPWDELLSENIFLEGIFLEKLDCISQAAANRKVKLGNFREGKTDFIASIKLIGDEESALFLSALKRAVGKLIRGFDVAIIEKSSSIIAAADKIFEFEEVFKGSKIKTPVFKATDEGKNVSNRKEFYRAVHNLSRLYHKDVVAFRIANEYLAPLVGSRKKLSNSDETGKAFKNLIAETTNLAISRIILLRFFEDHHFFGEKKYLCNGGVKAFQAMRDYFKKKYPILLRLAYEEASKIYEAVFEEQILDWILYSDNETLSDGMEYAMFYLSQFDFSTIKEDILSGIYGEIIPAEQRKALGQHYTPPSVARYLVRKTRVSTETRVLDPACGLGTFLVEGYNAGIGSEVYRGRFSYEQICERLQNIRGNDINAFSSTITQIQLIWNILRFKEQLTEEGFPMLLISGGKNSLKTQTLHDYTDMWSEIDEGEYDVVVGNPPYVRPERQGEGLGTKEATYYEEISHKRDLYTLFVYKAMKQWLKEDGVLGFVLPLSFCDNDGNHKLRQFFKVGQRWKILEIVDMEEISGAVFPDCAVNPILFIAKKSPATEDDVVTLKTAKDNCLVRANGSIIGFDIDKAETAILKYKDIWSTDDRILTRANPNRKAIADKIEAASTSCFENLARKYWVGFRGSKIEKWAFLKPEDEEGLRWEQRHMIGWGAAFRGEKHASTSGMDIYKGENITPCRIDGAPVEKNIEVGMMDDPSVWRYKDLLPKQGYAFARITLSPYATPFNPEEICFLNTATLFFPSKEYIDFPFDFLVLSSVYQWYFAVTQRESVMALSLRANIYPSTLGRFPWTDKLKEYTEALNELREKWLYACREKSKGLEVLIEKFGEMPTETLDERFGRIETLIIKHPGSLHEDKEKWYRVQISDDLFNYIDINHEETAKELTNILLIYNSEITHKELMSIRLPLPAGKEQWFAAIQEYKNSDAVKRIEAYISELDSIVAKCFDITEDMPFLLNDIKHDSLIKKLRATLPFSNKKVRGLLGGLDSSRRYSPAR